MSEEKREIVLAPGTYAYVQDVTTGAVKTYAGPCVINSTAQEMPVIYHPGDGSFRQVESLSLALQKSPVAVEGYYLELKNPALGGGDEHPSLGGAAKPSPELAVGRRVNIPGPCMFPLWPGQDAQYIRGHYLRSNQFLVVRVYNEEEARSNWTSAVVKTVDASDESAAVASGAPDDLTVGRLFIIKGTEVSFYIPPTGVTVVKAGDTYVRSALTLERLEYCILVDENGEKRYERGPQVVFPEPTETFVASKGDTKFRAIELNEIQGLHIKVIAAYTDGDTKYDEGDELFVTGETQAIYFPREEHSLISYDGKSKHFATAVPAGEARYVMNRMTGAITAVEGPEMLLPDPRTEVIVRRVLSQKQAGMWYPGNPEALKYNAELESIMRTAPTTRTGVVSEGDFSRGRKRSKKGGTAAPMANLPGVYSELVDSGLLASSSAMERSQSNRDQKLIAEEFSRGSTYTQPRTVTLDTKYQGVPCVEVWTGYAVMVKDKKGKRRVVEGPATILVQYDETFEILEMSSGKPKGTGKRIKTVYLRSKNNNVSDIVDVETADHVHVKVKLGLKVDFDGEPEKWFEVENYVKFITDRVRSILKGTTRNLMIEDFYANSTQFIRDTLLGTKDPDGLVRPGMRFAENGMYLHDVEVLRVSIADEAVADLLVSHQQQAVRDTLDLAAHRKTLERTLELEQLSRQDTEARHVTKMAALGLAEEVRQTNHLGQLAQLEREQAQVLVGNSTANIQTKAEGVLAELRLAVEQAEHEAETTQRTETQALDIQEMEAQTSAHVKRMEAVNDRLALALEQLADDKMALALVEKFGGLGVLKDKGTLATAREVLDMLGPNTFRIVKDKSNGASKVVGKDSTVRPELHE